MNMITELSQSVGECHLHRARHGGRDLLGQDRARHQVLAREVHPGDPGRTLCCLDKKLTKLGKQNCGFFYKKSSSFIEKRKDIRAFRHVQK